MEDEKAEEQKKKCVRAQIQENNDDDEKEQPGEPTEERRNQTGVRLVREIKEPIGSRKGGGFQMRYKQTLTTADESKRETKKKIGTSTKLISQSYDGAAA